MQAKIVEISGYVPAIMSLYMTGKNVDKERLHNIIDVVDNATDNRGFVTNPTKEFNDYMEKLIKYGLREEHGTILDFLKISIFMEGLHRGAMDDYDSHAKRLDIIRSSTRANSKSTTRPEVSDWYKERIKFFPDSEAVLPDQFTDQDNNTWMRTPWGYVREDLVKNNDALRGLVPLSLACDNISTISFRNFLHVYDLRRVGTHASPELQVSMELTRTELLEKSWYLGEYLGKVWVKSNGGHFEEKPDTILVSLNDFKEVEGGKTLFIPN